MTEFVSFYKTDTEKSIGIHTTFVNVTIYADTCNYINVRMKSQIKFECINCV